MIAVALILIVGLLSAGYISGRSRSERTGPRGARPTDPAVIALGSAVDTGIATDHVPVPAAAHRDADHPGVFTFSATTPYEAVLGWMSYHMPPGKSFGGLEWCDTKVSDDVAGMSVEWSWRHPGTNDFLVVEVGDDPAPVNGPFIVLNETKDDDPVCKSTGF